MKAKCQKSNIKEQQSFHILSSCLPETGVRHTLLSTRGSRAEWLVKGTLCKGFNICMAVVVRLFNG